MIVAGCQAFTSINVFVWLKALFYLWSIAFVVTMTMEVISAFRLGAERAVTSISDSVWGWITCQALSRSCSWLMSNWFSSASSAPSTALDDSQYMRKVYTSEGKPGWDWNCLPWGCQAEPTTSSTSTVQLSDMLSLLKDAISIFSVASAAYSR